MNAPQGLTGARLSTTPPRAMKPVVTVVVGAVLAVAVLLVVTGLILPRHWNVERTVTINAPPATIHTLVADLTRWPEWADREALASYTEYRYSGAARGAGAVREWQTRYGGSGRLQITRADPSLGVWFETSLEGRRGEGSVTYASNPGFTDVTWRDEGDLPPIIGGFMLDDLQIQLGGHFENGLVKLKALSELAERAKHAEAP